MNPFDFCELALRHYNTTARAAAIVNGNAFCGTATNRVFLCLRVALFNCSCAPNAAVHHRSDGLLGDDAAGDDSKAAGDQGARRDEDWRMLAVTPVRAGEELQICYAAEHLMLFRELRRAVLQNTHGFECRCGRCEAPMPDEGGSENAPDARLLAFTPAFAALPVGMRNRGLL